MHPISHHSSHLHRDSPGPVPKLEAPLILPENDHIQMELSHIHFALHLKPFLRFKAKPYCGPQDPRCPVPHLCPLPLTSCHAILLCGHVLTAGTHGLAKILQHEGASKS